MIYNLGCNLRGLISRGGGLSPAFLRHNPVIMPPSKPTVHLSRTVQDIKCRHNVDEISKYCYRLLYNNNNILIFVTDCLYKNEHNVEYVLNQFSLAFKF